MPPEMQQRLNLLVRMLGIAEKNESDSDRQLDIGNLIVLIHQVAETFSGTLTADAKNTINNKLKNLNFDEDWFL